jgi:hypothetical protein
LIDKNKEIPIVFKKIIEGVYKDYLEDEEENEKFLIIFIILISLKIINNNIK